MKNKRAIILLFAANIISGLAQGLSMIAIPWYFATIINRSDIYSMAFALISFVTLFWSLYAGTLIDKYPRKNIFIAANIIPFIVLTSVALFGQVTGAVEIWMALTVMGVTMLFYNVHYPALYAFNQEIIEPKYYGKINSWIEAQGQSTNIIAGAVAVLLLAGTEGLDFDLPFTIERWELYEIFTLDAITYVVAIILVSQIKYEPMVERIIHKGHIISRLKGGISYLRDNPSIFIFGVVSHAIFAFIIVEFYQLVPNFVDKFMQKGADVFASAEILYSGGALVAGLAFGSFLKTDQAVKRIIYFFAFIIVFCFALGFNNSIWLFFMANFVFGLTNAGTRILRITYLLQKVPNDVIGRANSVFSSINIFIRGMLSLLFAAPFFIEGDHVRWAYVVSAVFMLGSLIILILQRKKIESS